MDDLIYSFLLQSDFPRASVLFDLDMLGTADQTTRGSHQPSFVIVDPDNAHPLAVISVVDAVDGDTLRQVAVETGGYASHLAGKAVQGFVIRVDVRGRSESEQIQFYRVWPNSTLQQLTSKSFPDLETLRVARKLAQSANPLLPVDTVPEQSIESAAVESPNEPTNPGVGMYFPALLLLLLLLTEAYFIVSRGTSLLTVPLSVLAFGSAILFTLPAAIRYMRR